MISQEKLVFTCHYMAKIKAYITRRLKHYSRAGLIDFAQVQLNFYEPNYRLILIVYTHTFV